MSLFRFKFINELLKNRTNVKNMKHGPMRIEYFDKATHVGAFKMMRQINRQLDRGDGALEVLWLSLFMPIANLDRVT